MRQIALALLFTSSLLATGCNKNSASDSAVNATANLDAVALPHYMIEAGLVTGNHAAGINGSFKLVQATAPDGGPGSGITSRQLGGACIVFRAGDLGYSEMAGKTCTKAEDCATGEGAPYCQLSSGKCWSRPMADPDPLCRRSIDPGAPSQWPVGVDIKISDNPIPVPASLKPNAKALVIACLKGEGQANVCGTHHSIIKWGNESTIP